MKPLYSATCLCGHEFAFERETEAGVIVWVQCPACRFIFEARMPGTFTGRRTRTSTQRIQDAIFEAFQINHPPMTVRQLYYAVAVREVVPKTQAGYRQVCYQLVTLRERGILPYGWIADNTRWQIKPTTYTGLPSALETWHDAYRRDLWARQAAHVEIWVEKDALAGVIAPITRQYAVPLYVARGYSSKTFAYDAAEEIAQIAKPTYIYHFGDFDPSGVNAGEALQDELAKHGAHVQFARMAVTLAQIEAYTLPTLPVNRRDPRAKTWKHPFVCELDALPATELRALVEQCITQHIDAAAWNAEQQAEQLEKATLADIQAYFVQEQNYG